jgi:hypothetical protein
MHSHTLTALTVAGVLLLAGCTKGEGAEQPMPNAEKQSRDTEKVILDEDFEDGMDNWVVEDKGEHHKVKLEDGKLTVTMQSKMPGVFVWYKEDLPENFRLEYDFTPLDRGENDKGFYLLFFCARGKDQKDIFDPLHWEKSRLQDFRKYTKGDINCYHIGYLRGTTALCNLRKNPGLSLMQSNKVPQLKQGETYRITLTKQDAHITFEVKGPGIEKDQEKFIDWTDPVKDRPVWGGGKLAFRQIGYAVGVKGAYDNVRIIDLTSDAEESE